MDQKKEGKKYAIPCCGTCVSVQPIEGPIVLRMPKQELLAKPGAAPRTIDIPVCMCGNPEAPRFAIMQSVKFLCNHHKYQEHIPEDMRVYTDMEEQQDSDEDVPVEVNNESVTV